MIEQAIISEMGAIFSEDGVVETFQNDKDALAAAENDVAVVEMSQIGRIRVTGEDRIRFLHNQTTADFQKLKDGEGCDTVFVTSTGRTIDLAKAWVMKNSVILFVSPSQRQSLCALLNKYIFFADKVEVEDITDKTYYFTLVGPNSSKVLDTLGLEAIKDKPYGSFMHYAIEGTPVTVGVGSGLASPGYSFMLSTDTAGIVWEAILNAGAVPMGAAAWEQLRVWQGRPAPGRELTSEYNALEAGLWHTISMTKGCYIGQETIARLITYDGVKQQLYTVHMNGYAEPETEITCNEARVGKLTSCVEAKEGSEHSHVGLAYIRRKSGGENLVVDIGGVSGRVVEASFVKYALPPQ
nr:putative transferase At1g60990, chloroplastic isoform X2 [Physcomitrium patens]|eukprot:XP_024383690.1 putative transferase At1g60990, chloroplastic isoform X2 [Physcomitrella patens]